MRRVTGIIAALGACAAAAQAASALTVTPVNGSGLKKVISGYKGHVVLVNFWATWCIPCMAEYPGLVQVSHRYKKKGLVVLSVSGDKPRDITSKIVPFLIRQKASFPQFVITGDLDTFVNTFQPKWQADFPQTFVFDKRGRLVKELTGEQSVATWQGACVPLLNQPTAR